MTLGTAGHIDHGKTALVRALAAVTARLVAVIEREGSITLARARDEHVLRRRSADA
jgi:translation initiation factor 2 gamma subunit (eIF-2gamma)